MADLAEQAFRRHYGQVFRYLRRRTRNDYEAEELTQRVFADAVAALERIAPGTPMLAWLYTVARRRFADEVRRKERTRAPFDEERLGDVEHGPAVARALAGALGDLPVDQRRVIVAKLIRGLSFAEIAAAEGATEAACKMRLVRGLQQLRSTLEAEGIDR